MPETINDIMDELQGQPKYVSEVAERAWEAGKREAVTNKLLKERSIGHDEGYESGFQEAAGDPSAWYVKDIDGNEIHIGDVMGKRRVPVEALGCDCWCDADGVMDTASKCRKWRPDTKADLLDELVGVKTDYLFNEYEDFEGALAWAHSIFDRIQALGKVDV